LRASSGEGDCAGADLRAPKIGRISLSELHQAGGSTAERVGVESSPLISVRHCCGLRGYSALSANHSALNSAADGLLASAHRASPASHGTSKPCSSSG